MKRSMFVVLAALTLLFAAPVVAQQTEENLEESQLEQYESRTQPDADSIAPGSGLTITGTVVEWNDEQLTIKSATGVQHIQLTPRTERPAELTVGEGVSVDYTRTGQGIMIAQKIRPEGADLEADVATTELTTDTDTMDTDVQVEADVDANLDTTTEGELDAEADLDSDLDADVDADLDAQADLDTDATMDSELPATGSELPLLALLGLLGVAAAFGVRSFLR